MTDLTIIKCIEEGVFEEILSKETIVTANKRLTSQGIFLDTSAMLLTVPKELEYIYNDEKHKKFIKDTFEEFATYAKSSFNKLIENDVKRRNQNLVRKINK